MSKLTMLVVVIVGAVLIMAGVLKVEVHPDRLSEVPATVNQFVSDRGVVAQGRSLAVRLKRRGELFLADNADRKMLVALGYVETDTKRLADIIDAEESPKAIVPQAELLIDSLEAVKTQSAEASDDALAKATDRSREAMTGARESLRRLQELQGEYEWYQERLAGVTNALEGKVKALAEQAGDEGEVAGSQDEAEIKESPENNQSIPLRF